MDGNTRAIAEALRRWHEAPAAKVIDFHDAKRRIERERWLRKHTRPMPHNPPPSAA